MHCGGVSSRLAVALLLWNKTNLYYFELALWHVLDLSLDFLFNGMNPNFKLLYVLVFVEAWFGIVSHS